MLADFPIGPAEILPPCCSEYQTRGLGFGKPLLYRAVAAHLACGQVAQSDAKASRRMMRNRAAQPDFQVVRMRSEYKEVDSHHRVNSNA
jgi:hypothetical protein